MSKPMTANEVTAFAKQNPSLAMECIYDAGELFWPDELDEVMIAVLNTDFAALSLSQLKADLNSKVDAAAETERLRYITPGEGQAMTYQQKVDEARAFKLASDPQAADYPVLFSEVGITAPTLAEVADIVLAAFAQWQKIGAAIESIRLGAKRDINAARDEAAASSIFDAVTWPSAQVQA